MKTMKKKIITLCLVIAMLSVAVIGGTLAYFTDVDQATNEFTVGKLDIDLWEEVSHVDGAGNPKDDVYDVDDDGNKIDTTETLGKGDEVKVEYTYDAVMPGDVLTKKVTVRNEESEAVYVALSILQNNYGGSGMKAEDGWYNKLIDEYYEKAPFGASEKGYDHNEMQSLTSRTFTGEGWFDLAYTKIATDLPASATNHLGETIETKSNVRYYPTSAPVVDQKGEKSYVGVTGTQLIAVDYAVNNGTGRDHEGNLMLNGENGANAAYDKLPYGSRVWVYYLYLPSQTEMTFDLTITVPTEIDEYSLNAFQNMNLDVRAAAIQVSGFKTAYDAFVALEQAHPFDYGKLHAKLPGTPEN